MINFKILIQRSIKVLIPLVIIIRKITIIINKIIIHIQIFYHQIMILYCKEIIKEY